jgi:UDP-N-acetyl-D-glucosamine dehydrogenase
MTEHDRLIVMGQGYVGLPLALRAVDVGFDVVGFDVNKKRISQLTDAQSFIDDVSNADLKRALDTGRFQPTARSADLGAFSYAVVSVPTPLRNGAPDLAYVESAAQMIAPHIRPGSCVILESTTYPGTTEDVFIPLLESGSGLSASKDFAVGYSPERIDPSNPHWTLINTPKIVSGLDDRSLKAVRGFFDRLVDTTVPVPGLREAEMAKLLENTFRHVNIALVNELAMYSHELGIDIWSVIDAASTKPFGFMRFTPGPGVGGHCLPIDPSYLSWQVKQSLGQSFRFIELANDVNEHMPDHIVSRATGELNGQKKSVNGANILAIGLAYKKNSGDARESPAIGVVERLRDLGANVRTADSLVDASFTPLGTLRVEITDVQLEEADLIIILTDHDSVDWDQVRHHATKVLDTRNRLGGRSPRL